MTGSRAWYGSDRRATIQGAHSPRAFFRSEALDGTMGESWRHDRPARGSLPSAFLDERGELDLGPDRLSKETALNANSGIVTQFLRDLCDVLSKRRRVVLTQTVQRLGLCLALLLAFPQEGLSQQQDPPEAEALNRQVLQLYSQGRYTQAIPLAEKTLAIREKALGPEHPSVALSLNNLAESYCTLGDSAKAEPLYRRSLAIYEKALGPEHPDVAHSLNNLAVLYDDRGDYAKAEPLYRRSLAINEKALGPEHPDVAISLNNLAMLYLDPRRLRLKPSRCIAAASRSTKKPSAPSIRASPSA